MDIVTLYLIVSLLAGLLAALVARRKNRGVFGWAFLCLLLPLAFFFLFVLPKRDPE